MRIEPKNRKCNRDAPAAITNDYTLEVANEFAPAQRIRRCVANSNYPAVPQRRRYSHHK
jgi:hypothetical protein